MERGNYVVKNLNFIFCACKIVKWHVLFDILTTHLLYSIIFQIWLNCSVSLNQCYKLSNYFPFPRISRLPANNKWIFRWYRNRTLNLGFQFSPFSNEVSYKRNFLGYVYISIIISYIFTYWYSVCLWIIKFHFRETVFIKTYYIPYVEANLNSYSSFLFVIPLVPLHILNLSLYTYCGTMKKIPTSYQSRRRRPWFSFIWCGGASKWKLLTFLQRKEYFKISFPRVYFISSHVPYYLNDIGMKTAIWKFILHYSDVMIEVRRFIGGRWW